MFTTGSGGKERGFYVDTAIGKDNGASKGVVTISDNTKAAVLDVTKPAGTYYLNTSGGDCGIMAIQCQIFK